MLDPRNRPRIRKRKQQIKHTVTTRTNTWFLVSISGLCWVLHILILVLVPPSLIRDVGFPGMFLPFFGVLGLALVVTLYLITKRFQRSVLFTLVIVIFLYLRLFDLGNWYNTLLLGALICLIEVFYFGTRLKLPFQKPKL